MTELQPGLTRRPEANSRLRRRTPAADVAWPELPTRQLPAELSGHAAAEHRAAAVLDPAVNAVLDRLAAVRQTPVSGHGEVYAGMHDALLEALNEDVTGHAGVARRIHAAGNGDREPA